MKQVIDFVKKAINIVMKPEMRILPGQLAFFFVISLIPLFAVIVALAGQLSLSTEVITDTILGAFPTDTKDFFLNNIATENLNFNIIIFFISAFFLASNGTHSMIITSNEIYKISSDHVINRRVKAIVMIGILVLLIVFLLIVPVVADVIYNGLKDITDNNRSANNFYAFYQLLRYPITILLLYLNIKLLYIIAPDKKIKAHAATTGAIFTTICWILATEIYGFYIGSFSTYSVFYGSISNILILLLWVYILSYIFVMGMALNASSTKEEDILNTKIGLIS